MSSDASQWIPREYEGLPASAKLIYRMLEDADEPLTAADINEETGVARSTARRAVEDLREAGAPVEKRPNTNGDPRAFAYVLDSGDAEGEDAGSTS